MLRHWHSSARSAFLAAVMVVVLPGIARAESAAPPCWITRVLPTSAEIPANTTRFAVAYAGHNVDTSRIRLAHLGDDGTRTELPGALSVPAIDRAELVIDAALVPGERYVLEHPICRDWEGVAQPETEYLAGPPALAPSAAGTLDVSPVYAANYVRGERFRYYFVRVAFTPDASLEPWLASADGEIRASRPELARPLPLATGARLVNLTITCRDRMGQIDEGPQTFDGHVDVLGFERLPIPPLDAEIDCGDATRVDPETLRPLTPEEQRHWDTEPDSGSPELDAGTGMGVADAGDPDAPEEPSRGGACSVGHGRAAATPAAALLATLALALLRRRGRR